MKTTSKLYLLSFSLWSVFAFSQQSICDRDPANIAKTYSVDAPSGTAGSTYNWSLSATTASITSGQSTNQINVNWGTTPPGNYTITVTETNNGCIGDPKVLNVTINAKPTVSLASTLVCEGEEATVTATPGAPGTYSYAWTVPTGATPPGNVANFNTRIAGTYAVVITNTTTGCSSDSQSTTVSFKPKPVTSDIVFQ